jgi:serine/threonine protein kinase
MKDPLGRGSYSDVILAEDIHTNKPYALKIINKKMLQNKKKGFRRDEEGNIIVDNLLQDALKEIAILKKMNHNNVIKLHEIIHDDEMGEILLVLDFCSLGHIIQIEDDINFVVNPRYVMDGMNTYTDDQIKDILRDVVLGLDYLHANNIVHRDIKPDNILVTEDKTCKITDFNVSVLLDEKSNGSNSTGTLYFNAPEICGDEQDPNAIKGKPLDIWALGVTTYLLAFSKLPFVGENSMDVSGILESILKSE